LPGAETGKKGKQPRKNYATIHVAIAVDAPNSMDFLDPFAVSYNL
jgi:hypothetical protein